MKDIALVDNPFLQNDQHHIIFNEPPYRQMLSIGDMSIWPFYSHGLITVDFRDLPCRNYGTGVLIHKRYVLTCAHIFCHPVVNGEKCKIPSMCQIRNDSMKVTFTIYDERFGTKIIKAIKLKIGSNFETTPQNDYALLTLESSINRKCYTIDTETALDPRKIDAIDLSVVSHEFNSQNNSIGSPYRDIGKKSTIDERYLYYKLDTFEGTSGSAIWHDNKKGKIIGIHKGVKNGFNYAILLNDDQRSEIHQGIL